VKKSGLPGLRELILLRREIEVTFAQTIQSSIQNLRIIEIFYWTSIMLMSKQNLLVTSEPSKPCLKKLQNNLRQLVFI
jgi:hypothetical protein